METMRYHNIQSNSMQYPTMPGNTMEIIKIRSFWLLHPPPWCLLSNMSNRKKLSF